MEHVTTEIPDLLLNALPEPDRRRVERHLAECPSCREEWGSISTLRPPRSPREILSQREVVPSGYFSTLPARILERRQTGSRRSADWIRPVLQNYLAPLAAGVIVLVALSAVSLDIPTDKEVAGLPVSPGDAVEYVWENAAIAVLEPTSSPMAYLSDASMASQELNGIYTPGLEDLDPQLVQDIVSGLSDAEVDRLVVRLNERTIL